MNVIPLECHHCWPNARNAWQVSNRVGKSDSPPPPHDAGMEWVYKTPMHGLEMNIGVGGGGWPSSYGMALWNHNRGFNARK